MKKRVRWRPAEQVYDGDTVEVVGRWHRIQCCDCGLVHKLRFAVIGGTAKQPRNLPKAHIFFRVWLHNRATAQVRRKKQAKR